MAEVYQVVSHDGLRKHVEYLFIFSVMGLIVGYNLFISIKYIRYSRTPIQRLCLAMNVFMMVCSFILVLRDIGYYTCSIFTITFFVVYLGTITFLGFILVIKVYYASNYRKLLLFGLLTLQSAVVAIHVWAMTQAKVHEKLDTKLCDFTQEQSSFAVAMASDLVFNSLVTFLFLHQIYRASLRVRSSLYTILIRDGMVFWILTAIFPIVIAIVSFLGEGFGLLPVLFVLYVVSGSTAITWQIFRNARKNRQPALSKS
ncbi:hypothetical protein IWQ62_001759 [Dispira parvispora]|uniref:Uncharacterized protein n=1 Tax=Dispira parvispora TaxID=1520584 RepID=A0A9W8E870_9FUNG|nr:hypothetical protein IWQ62_001759 [Dispira parvispora]